MRRTFRKFCASYVQFCVQEPLSELCRPSAITKNKYLERGAVTDN